MPRIVKIMPTYKEVELKPETKAEQEARRKARMLDIGQIVVSEHCQFIVQQLIGSGMFGEVYMVASVKNPEKKYAMKTEGVAKDPSQKMYMRLKIAVYNAITDAKDDLIDKSHFVHLIAKGMSNSFKYYVMDLAWKPLNGIIEMLGGKIRPHSKISIARQTLAGIEGLHTIGFIHRDIKPGNYAVGLPPNDKIIYTLDFGIAKEYRDKNKKHNVPRDRVRFLGTPKYASINGLEERDQGRRDDLEAWLYMMIEIYDPKNMPWADEEDFVKCIKMRRDFFRNADRLHSQGVLPYSFYLIAKTINKMSFYDAGKFDVINGYLDAVVREEKIDMSLPLDWVGKYEEIQKKKKEEEEKREKERKEKEKKEEEKRKKKRAKKHRRRRHKKTRERTEDNSSGEDEGEVVNEKECEEFYEWINAKRKREKLAAQGHKMTFVNINGEQSESITQQITLESGGKKYVEDNKEPKVTAKEKDEKRIETPEKNDENPEKKKKVKGEKTKEEGDNKKSRLVKGSVADASKHGGTPEKNSPASHSTTSFSFPNGEAESGGMRGGAGAPAPVRTKGWT